MFDFSGQVFVISGAGGHLGQTLAAACDRAGASVVLVDHRAGRLESLFPGWVGSERHMLAEGVDVADFDQSAALAAQVVQRYARVDVLLCPAGGWVGGKTVDESDAALWKDALQRGLYTAVAMSRAVLPQMMAQESGVIVTVGSKAALQGSARNAAYAASKGALLRFTESLSAEVKGHGVRVNCVLPSTMDSPANRASMPKADFSKWTTVDAVADVMLFLASPLARDIHGAAIPVFGKV